MSLHPNNVVQAAVEKMGSARNIDCDDRLLDLVDPDVNRFTYQVLQQVGQAWRLAEPVPIDQLFQVVRDFFKRQPSWTEAALRSCPLTSEELLGLIYHNPQPLGDVPRVGRSVPARRLCPVGPRGRSSRG